MPEISVLIIEDEALYADQLEMQLEQLGYAHLGTVDNSSAALSALEEQLPQLILMDIHIRGDYDGVELADMITQRYDIPIIFITSLQDDLTFKRASRTKPASFLVKPFQALQLQRTIELVTTQLPPATEAGALNIQDDQFFIKSRQKLEQVRIADILYLKADGRYTEIHTTQKRHLLRKPLQQLAQQLANYNFMATHRSYIVNRQHIDTVDLEDSVVMLGDVQVPISKRYRESVSKQLGI
ncbi:MAG: LytTR family transcriptional regulator DNA-binding domain-containing protein [Bacteroidota bacterium]